MKKLILSLAASCLFLPAFSECTVIEIPLSQRAAASSLIVEGQVTGQQSYWDANHTMIYTAHTIEVYKVFKGTSTPSYIQVLTQGGTVGMNRITVEPSLELRVGDIGIFTCDNVTRIYPASTQRSSVPQYEPYASVQGFVKYDMASETASDPFQVYTNIENQVYNTVQQSSRGYREVRPFSIHSSTRSLDPQVNVTAITGFSPTTVTAGTGTTITITGTGFGATQGSGVVRFRNADDGGATTITPLPSQYISWSSTQIVVEVPSEAGTGTIQVTQGITFTSAGTLTVDYAHLNVLFDPGPGTIAYQTDHVDDNGSGGYTWRMNTGFDADAPARASFMRAFDTWRCNTNVNWTIGATTSINDAVSDGTNIICYDNTVPLSPGILGVCFSYWSGCASGPNIVWYVNELDIIFDEGSNITPLTWEFGPATPSGSEYDFETVAVHELGHGHQLGHVIAPGAIMHYAISNGTSNRSLGTEDLAGGNFVQAKSIVANLCGPGAMTNHSCATPPVAAFSGTPTTICAGETVAFTDLSTNTPTSWAWTFTGGTPSASTAQNPTITYNTPGVYDVTLTATNASGSDPVTIVGYITVNALPTVTASASPSVGPFCAGEMVTLSGNGATSYVWTGGVTDGVPFATVSTDTYTVTGTDGNGCEGTDAITITVNNLPNVVASASPSNSICAGASVTLSGSGANSYVWTGGVTDGIPFTPVSTDTYTVTGTDGNGCEGTDVITVTVNGLPTVVANASPSTTVCSGTMVTLSGSGAASYSWTGGVQDGVPFTAVATDTYTVIGTDGNGCDATDVITITVNSCGVSSVPCGNTYFNMMSQASAAQVPGAVSYRFTFYDNVSGLQVAQRTQASRTLTFGNVSGLYYNTTYRWTVAVDVGSGFGAESNSACTIIFGQPNPVVPCGISSPNGLNFTASASVATGIVGYRFRFYDNVSLVQVAQHTQASRTLLFGNVAGLYNNMTYRWTVAIEYALSGGGTAFGPESSNACTVTFGAPQTTVPCGNTYTVLNASVVAPAVYGAVNYRFTFYDNVSGLQVAQRTQASNTLIFSNVSGIYYGNTYRWSVAVEYNVSTGGTAFGAESNTLCTVTFAAPQTVVPCGGTYNYATGSASATAKFGATGYRFRFYQGVTLMGQRTQVSRTLSFVQVPGLANNQAYTWTVEVEYNNGVGITYGPPSTACPVTLGTPPPTPSHNPEGISQETESKPVLTLQIYPNPTRDRINIVTNEPVEMIYLYTITGALIKSANNVTEIGLAEFNPGTYVVMVQTASGMQRTLVVKE